MRTRLRSALSYSNVVATFCLFVVLGGSAYAASSGLIDGKRLKPRSVTAAKVKKNSLTGKEINEQKLARVPDAARLNGKPASAYLTAGAAVASATNATHADSATSASNATNATNATNAADAAKLGGKDASAFLTSDRVLSGSGDPTATPAQVLFNYAPLALTVQTDGDADTAQTITFVDNGGPDLDVSSSADGTVHQGIFLKDNETLVGAQVGTFVIRSEDSPHTAISVTCGFDQAPGANVVNCTGIPIG